MKKNNLNKGNRLYIVIVGLLVLMIGMFVYFQKRLNELQKHAETNSEIAINIYKKLNNTIELNYLSTDNYKYLINPSDWKETLKSETALNLDDLGIFKINKVIMRKNNNMESGDLNEYTITIDIPSGASFKEFTDLMYKKINDILILSDNDTSKVESFKEGRGYYDINSFEEATYNNMYYDYIKTLSDGTIGGPKVKVTILYLEETNQITMEINKF